MRRPLSILIVAAFTQVGATDCGNTILKDPGFELWCGDELCSWKLLRGEVRQAPTWHKEDTGVELVGPDVAVAQLTSVNDYDGTCIRFELVANVDENAEARLELDVYGDGTIDLSERMPTARWKPLSWNLKLQAPYSGVRFILSKKGSGKAVFAQIEARIERDGCDGLTEIVPGRAPLGAPCTENARCESRICDEVPDPDFLLGTSRQCVGCMETTCAVGQACGRGEAVSPVLDVPVVCVGAASRELGEQCLGNAECASNMCRNSVCSACFSGTCASTDVCSVAYPLGPSVCAPGLGRRAATEPCASHLDCASNLCNGAVRKQCSDGRACDGRDDCPAIDSLEPGACEAVGIQGGRCQ